MPTCTCSHSCESDSQSTDTSSICTCRSSITLSAPFHDFLQQRTPPLCHKKHNQIRPNHHNHKSQHCNQDNHCGCHCHRRHHDSHSHQHHSHEFNLTKTSGMPQDHTCCVLPNKPLHKRQHISTGSHSCDSRNEPTSFINSTSRTSDCRHSLSSDFRGLPPTYVSVNLRYAGSDRVLLRDDVFIPVDSAETLAHHFRSALARHPTHVGRYVLRKDKSVIVLSGRGKDHSKESSYSKTSALFGTLSNIKPRRLIFCVFPNAEVIRMLDERKTYSLTFNARNSRHRKCILDDDIVIETSGGATVAEVWENLKIEFKQLSHLEVLALQTVRTPDRIGLRFCPEDVVADIVKSGGKRFVFILDHPGLTLEQVQEHQHHKYTHRHHGDKNNGLAMKLKSFIGIEPEPRKHERRRV